METLCVADSLRMCRKHGIRVAGFAEARNERELSKALGKAGFPAVVKLNSLKVSHKSDRGGVVTGISSFREARAAFRRMKRLPGYRSVIVQEMAKGTELIIGARRDVQFGPVVLVGMGGVYAEALGDVAVAICPVSRGKAVKMLKSLKGSAILRGMRGGKGIDFHSAAEQVVKLSGMMRKNKSISEVDLNPVMARHSGAVAVDARVLLAKQ